MFPKPRPIFAEMPWNIKQDIIDLTDLKTRCVLRKCSKTLRFQVNHSYSYVIQQKFELFDNMVKLTIQNDDEMNNVIAYRSEVDGCLVNGKFIFGENYINRSVADFASVVRHPKTFVEDVTISDSSLMGPKKKKMRVDTKMALMRAFEKEFCSCTLNILSFQLLLELSQQDQMRMLALTCSGLLEIIALKPVDEYQDTSEIIASEHWELAEEVEMFGFRKLPAQSLTIFPFWRASGIKIRLKDVKVFVEKIFEHGESFEEWRVLSGRLKKKALNYLVSNFNHRNGGTEHLFLKKMPGTMYHLKIEIWNRRTTMNFSKVLSSEVEVVDLHV